MNKDKPEGLDEKLLETLGYVPKWRRFNPPRDYSNIPKQAPIKVRKTVLNNNREYLDMYTTYSDAIIDHPILGDIIEGVSRLDYGGNTRSLNPKVFFLLLRDVEELSTQSIAAYTYYGKSHCERLLSGMRIIVRMFDDYVAKLQHKEDYAQLSTDFRSYPH